MHTLTLEGEIALCDAVIEEASEVYRGVIGEAKVIVYPKAIGLYSRVVFKCVENIFSEMLSAIAE